MIKLQYHNRAVRQAKRHFTKAIDNKDYTKATRIVIIIAMIMANSRNLFHALQEGNRIYHYAQEVKKQNAHL